MNYTPKFGVYTTFTFLLINASTCTAHTITPCRLGYKWVKLNVRLSFMRSGFGNDFFFPRCKMNSLGRKIIDLGFGQVYDIFGFYMF